MKAKNWLLWSLTNIILGLLGYIVMGMIFMVTIAIAGANVVVVYLVLGIVGLLLLYGFYYTNRTVYKSISERTKENIPHALMLGGNMLAWITLILIYIAMSYLA